MAPRGAVIVLGVLMVALLTVSASEVTARELTEETKDAVQDQHGGGGYRRCQYGCCGVWYNGYCSRCCQHGGGGGYQHCQYGCCGSWYNGYCSRCCQHGGGGGYQHCQYGCCGSWYNGYCSRCCQHGGGGGYNTASMDAVAAGTTDTAAGAAAPPVEATTKIIRTLLRGRLPMLRKERLDIYA